MAKSGLQIKTDNLHGVLAGIAALESTRVMVGIPQDDDARKKTSDSEPGNAALGYIHENGAPEVNIPARPWLVPPVEAANESIVQPGLRRAGELALEGRPEGVMRVYHAMGLRVQAAIRQYMGSGISPPLAERTLRGRAARGRAGAAQELANRARGLPASTSLAVPLIDTGQLRNAVTYVIRTVRGGR